VKLTRIVSVGIAVLSMAVPARAAELKLEFRDGRVTLVAHDVSIRQILNEWAKLGETQIVNAERVSGTPVTLQLDGVPERQALDVILRSAAGYLAAPRKPGNPGPSTYDRILVMAVSSPPQAQTRPGTATSPAFPTARETVAPLPPPPGPLFPPRSDDDGDEATNLVPRPGGLTPGMPGTSGVPGAITNPVTPGGTQPVYRSPGSIPVTATPGGTSVPGIVTPVPTQPNQPPVQQSPVR